MSEKENKKVFDNIKTEAKEYYKWKNMIVRYIILWFLVVLLVIQFILPHNKKQKDEVLDSSNNTEISQNKTDKILDFLWEGDVDLSEMDNNTKSKFNTVIKTFKHDLEYKYTFSHYYFPELIDVFGKYDIPVEFCHIAILNNSQQPYRQMEEDLREYYGVTISSEIDERLNEKKAAEAVAMYLSDLHKKFKDWRLVLVAYFMWADELEDQMNLQWVKSLDELYIPMDIKDKYTEIMAYSYAFQNLKDLVDTEKLTLTENKETTTITVSETKDLVKRAKKNKYSYKEIKELNPRILWNSLPKWKREITISR